MKRTNVFADEKYITTINASQCLKDFVEDYVNLDKETRCNHIVHPMEQKKYGQ